MTSIRRSVKRLSESDTVWNQGKSRKIVAKLGPGDVVYFRLLGTRLWTDGLSIKEMFWMAIKRTVRRQWLEENERRKALNKRLKRKPTLLR